MKQVSTKITSDTYSADEFNKLPSQELQNAVLGSGQTLTEADLNQLGKAISIYSGAGDFYTESGSVNSYVLSPIGTPARQVSANYIDGLRVRFVAGSTNTGTSTINLNAIGAKALKENGSDIPAGRVIVGNIIEAVFISATDQFELVMNTLMTAQQFGVTGDGIANDTAAFVLALANSGTNGNTLFIDVEILTDAFSIPDNVRIIMGPSGKVILRTTVGTFVDFGSNINIDGNFQVEVPTGITITRAVSITGDSNVIDKLTITSVDTQFDPGDSGIRVDGDDNYINYISVDNYDIALADQGARNKFMFITADNWHTGVWLNLATDGFIGGYHLWNTTAPVSFNTGENGIITTAPKNYIISPGTIYQSPEHGIYMAGNDGVTNGENVTFGEALIIRPGGSGVKVQGTNTLFHDNINIKASVIDCNLLAGGTTTAIELENIRNCKVEVTVNNLDEVDSSDFGVSIDRAENLTLIPTISNPDANAIEITANLGNSDGIHIYNPVCSKPDEFSDWAAVNIRGDGLAASTIKNVNVHNIYASGFKNCGRILVNTTTTVTDVNFYGGNGNNTQTGFANNIGDELFFTGISLGANLIAASVGSDFHDFDAHKTFRKLYDTSATSGWFAEGALPRITTTVRDAITTSELPSGFLIKNTTTVQLEEWDGGAWVAA